MNGVDALVGTIVSSARVAVFGKDVVQSFSELFRMYHDAPHGVADLISQITSSNDQIKTTVDPKIHADPSFVSQIVKRYQSESQNLIADLRKISTVHKSGKIDRLLRCRAAIAWWIKDKHIQKGLEGSHSGQSPCSSGAQSQYRRVAKTVCITRRSVDRFASG